VGEETDKNDVDGVFESNVEESKDNLQLDNRIHNDGSI
jgi:hypothetical protein